MKEGGRGKSTDQERRREEGINRYRKEHKRIESRDGIERNR